MNGSDVTTREELLIEASLNASLLIPHLWFLNYPVVKQLYLHFGKKLIMHYYGVKKLMGYEKDIDDDVDGKNKDLKASIEVAATKIEQGATDEEIAIARKNVVDNARKLVRSGGNIVQG